MWTWPGTGDRGSNCHWNDLSFEVEKKDPREGKEHVESDGEDSATPSEDMTSSPFGQQHNGSYQTADEEDASLGAN